MVQIHLIGVKEIKWNFVALFGLTAIMTALGSIINKQIFLEEKYENDPAKIGD
jgi:hypothetical protein